MNESMAEQIAEAMAKDLNKIMVKLDNCQTQEEEEKVIAELRELAREAGKKFGAAFLDAMVEKLKRW